MTKQDVKTAWTRVADELSSLGLKLKYHVEQEFADDDTPEVKAALKKLSDAVEDAAEAVGNAASDPAVREDLAEAGHRIVEAIGTTVSQAGDEIRTKLNR